MLAAFAQHLETPTGDVFVTYEKVAGGISYRASKKLRLWTEKPKLDVAEAFVKPGTSDAVATSEVTQAWQGPGQGLGGIEALPSDTEAALKTLLKEMELIQEEKSKEVNVGGQLKLDTVQSFLYTLRRREQK